MKIKLSLEAQLSLLILALTIFAVCLVSLFNYWLNSPLIAAIFSLVLIVPTAIFFIRLYMNPINRLLSALNDGFHNFLDNDFSVSLAKMRNDELGKLVEVYNQVGEALRDERIHLYQRELLLDTVIQTTPLSLVLTDDSDAIIYSNSAARQLVFSGKAINGYNFKQLLENKPASFIRAVNSGLNGLFTTTQQENNETYHLTQNQFLLNGRKHHLYLFKTLTKEISRQEVLTWKKVIRLISHELNNSLAPITSLAHSGQTLCERQDDQRLKKIFSTMEERARYLQTFIEGYAKFARLPKPQVQQVEVDKFLLNLQSFKPFIIDELPETKIIYCDPAQMQQAMINLIKNAHESGSTEENIHLKITVTNESFEIQIKDRGKGMSDKNLDNALLPFYSTKSEGTGLGLPLCREIVEAHGGKMMLSNRKNGGLKISLLLPNHPSK